MAITLLGLLQGCASVRQPAFREKLAIDALEQRCEPPPRLMLAPIQSGAPDGQGTRGGQPLVPYFSEESRAFARTIGLTPLLAALVEASTAPAHADEQRLRSLEARQALSDRLLLLSLEIAGVVAELDCEAARASHLANGLEEARDRRIRTLTLIAIIGDALVGILAGGLSLAMEETASAAAAISGGAIATTFGIAAIFSGKQHEFRHERNLLGELWGGPPAPTLWPPAVWRFLTAPAPSGPSPRESVLTHWRQEGFLGTPDDASRPARPYFGAGAIYDIEALRTREVMLETVKSEVNRMHQNLNLLMQEILALANPAASTHPGDPPASRSGG